MWSHRPRCGSTLARGLVLAAALAAGVAWPVTALGAAPSDLRLEIVAPSSLDGEVAALRWLPTGRWAAVAELVGLDAPGPPIRVLVLPEEHELARRAPRGISGFAVAAESTVVLFPERVTSYPYDSLTALLSHEVAHVLLDRAAGGEPLPRWFQEGVALHAARDWQLADRERLLIGGVSGVPPSTAELERAFRGEGYAIPTAYALAGALVQELVRGHGPQAVAEIARQVRAGHSFADAFGAATGMPLATFEQGFWRRFRLLYRWLPFLTSSAALWMAVTVLAMVAMAHRRARDAALRRRWAEEEAAAEALAAVAVGGDGVAEGRAGDPPGKGQGWRGEVGPWGPH